ncbi:Alpha/Beta hydrolase protein [Fusarium oxysporum]|nr:Alpha/Beta hydrolase protein [Fusarium oxysporum]
MGSYHFKHEHLGEVIGLERGTDIIQFRGIPYATIPARFRQSILNGTLPSQPFDARQPGPFCEDYPALTASKGDEYGCLNLNITAPTAALENAEKGKIPVLVFIHGGAFISGSQCIAFNGREIFDPTNLVQVSLKRNQAIVVVTINYRLGPLGFLASKDLETYNKAHGEPVGNYGLHDQARALDWVNKFIHGFGGDPDEVTVNGTSAGAISTHYQTLFPGRKFKRAIMSSGTIIGLGPQTMDEHEANFSKYVEAVSDSNTPNTTTIELLQAAPVQELVTAVPAFISYPLVDGQWVKGGSCDSLAIQNPPDIMIGSCAYEQDVAEFLLEHAPGTKSLSDDRFLLTVKEVLSTNSIFHDAVDLLIADPDIREAYGVRSNDSADLQNWAALIGDVMFRIPVVFMASLQPDQPMLIYEIAATNPFTNSAMHYQKANHGLNDILLFDVAEDAVPEKHLEEWRGAVATLQSVWLDFSHGLTPWPPAKSSGEDLGPFYRVDNTTGGVVCQSLDELVGKPTAERWSIVLRQARIFQKQK